MIKGAKSDVSKLEEKFIVKIKVVIPPNNKNEPLRINKIEIIVIPIGLLIFIKKIINTSIYKYIIQSILNIIESISYVQSILGGNILTIIINIIIIYYLYRKEVKDYFHNVKKKSSFSSSSLDDLR